MTDYRFTAWLYPVDVDLRSERWHEAVLAILDGVRTADVVICQARTKHALHRRMLDVSANAFFFANRSECLWVVGDRKARVGDRLSLTEVKPEDCASMLKNEVRP